MFLSNPQDDLAAIRSAKGDRVDGTCEWILTQDRYTSWLNEDSPQLLWLSGLPGIGKTMISSFLVEELALLAERSSQMTLAYYFCDDKDEKRRTATAVLRGLLLQLLRQRPVLFKHIQTQFDISRDSLFSNFHALWRIFVSIVQDPEAGEVCCLIDALDECEKESRQLFLNDLTKLFCSQQSKKPFLKLIVISRQENDIEESLSTVSSTIQNIQIDSGKVNQDLSKFINLKVDELATKKRYSSDTKNMIKQALTEKAGGTFLYVSLVLDDLKKTKITSQVRQKLQMLPPDLNNVYDRILSNIDIDYVEVAKLILCWVVVARRPLMVKELAMVRALSTEEWESNTVPPQDVLDELKDGFKCCEPLVYLDTVENTVNLVHQSAKDYLLGRHLQENAKNLSQYHVIVDRTERLIFRTCWKCLSFKEYQGTVIMKDSCDGLLRRGKVKRTFIQSHCFLVYARLEWATHALAAGPALAVDFGFTKDALDRFPNLRDAWLIRAAAKGQKEVVQRLLENGADPESADNSSWPLLEIASHDDMRVVELLLSRGGRGTPLMWAAFRGHESVVKLLLDWEAAAVSAFPLIISRDQYDDTPLVLAAWKGHEAIVKLLLSSDHVAVDFQHPSGPTALSLAAQNGHAGVLKLLLEHNDTIIDLKDESGQTLLSRAAENGHEAVVELLLNRNDLAVNSKDIFGLTPLWWAVSGGHEIVVKQLLNRKDVAIDSEDICGRTPLSWAADRGHEAVVKQLLSRKDVTIDSKDKDGRTPLWWATRAGHEPIMKLLEQRMRDIGCAPHGRKRGRSI